MKKLVFLAILAIVASTALAVPPDPNGNYGNIAQTEIPVVILIDRYAEVTVGGSGEILLQEKPAGWWEGSTDVTVACNWSVIINAVIEKYLPSIVKGSNGFQVLIEGDLGGWGDDKSSIQLMPYPDGYTFRVWAGILEPDLLARTSSPDPQRVATVYLTVQD